MRKALCVILFALSCSPMPHEVAPEPCSTVEECTRTFDIQYRPDPVVRLPTKYPTPLSPWCQIQRDDVCRQLWALSEAGYIDEEKVWYLCVGPGKYRFKCKD